MKNKNSELIRIKFYNKVENKLKFLKNGKST